MKLRYILILSCAGLLSLQSCSDVLDKAPDGKMALEEVWKDHNKVGAFLNSCYNQIPYKGIGYFFWDNMPVAMCDDAYSSDDGAGQMLSQLYAGQASASGHGMNTCAMNEMHAGYKDYWEVYFAQIRLCSQFLQNIDLATVNTETDRNRWRAEAHVMRAFFYSELVKWYGRVPIEREPYGLTEDFSKVERSSVYDVVKFISEDCDAAINAPELPWRISSDSEAMRATKALAYAIKSRMWLFAASPLHNGGNNYWEEAYNQTKKAVEELKANGYALYKNCSNTTTYGTGPANAWHELVTTTMKYSTDPVDKETIWQLSPTRRGGDPTWQLNYVFMAGFDKCGACPTQEFVDAFEVVNGDRTAAYPLLNLSKPYNDEKHLQPNYNQQALTVFGGTDPYATQDPYKNRDPRFYASVLYNGANFTWNGISRAVESYDGGANRISFAPADRRFTRTGYYQKKTVVPGASDQNPIAGATWKHFRLAEVILNYAEAAAEYGAGNALAEAKAAVDEVRSRVGMPPLPTGLSQQELILRVRNERRVEMSWEETRYFDLRRWQQSTGNLSETCKWLTAMWITKTGSSYTYERKNITTSPRFGYENKDLLLPLHVDEVSIMESLTGAKWQNPGW
mgnify:FL=1